ncbi:MAG: formylglycine-generating enzyme family protein [Planctomycetota bacterium]|jgi:formylglycine-generating enzyme required for sulfatase activity
MKKLMFWSMVLCLFFQLNISEGIASEQPISRLRKNKFSTNNMELITSGEFQMGSDLGEDDEIPLHIINVDAFYMDKYEVTNREFKKFIKANPQWSKENIPSKYCDGDYLKHWVNETYPPNLANHPVVYVSWYAAKAYADWQNKRLPTEAEWEKAASYNLSNKNIRTNHKHKWSFGDVFNPRAANTAHYNGLPIGGWWRMWWKDFSSNLTQKVLAGETTIPVGKFAPGANNLYDTTGNVWEWCLDWYRGDSYLVEARKEKTRKEKVRLGQQKSFDYLYEPTYGDKESSTQVYRVLRGGSWAVKANLTRTTNRFKFKQTFTDNDVGFRCAGDYTPNKNQIN